MDKSFIKQEFTKFLQTQNMYAAFVYNLREAGQGYDEYVDRTLLEGRDTLLITSAFIWGKVKEGVPLWSKLTTLWHIHYFNLMNKETSCQ